MAQSTDSDHVRGYFEASSWKDSAGRRFLAEERVTWLHRWASKVNSTPGALTICDVGCGGGRDLASWRDFGVPESNLAGTELVPDRAARTRSTVPGADIRVVRGFDLPFADSKFDITSASLVLSTTPSRASRARLMAEMARITKPDGLVLVYDFVISKPWNTNVSRVTATELASLWRRPDAARRLGPFLPGLEVALHLPTAARQLLIKLLPRTHRLWVWRVTGTQGPVAGVDVRSLRSRPCGQFAAEGVARGSAPDGSRTPSRYA